MQAILVSTRSPPPVFAGNSDGHSRKASFAALRRRQEGAAGALGPRGCRWPARSVVFHSHLSHVGPCSGPSGGSAPPGDARIDDLDVLRVVRLATCPRALGSRFCYSQAKARTPTTRSPAAAGPPAGRRAPKAAAHGESPAQPAAARTAPAHPHPPAVMMGGRPPPAPSPPRRARP